MKRKKTAFLLVLLILIGWFATYLCRGNTDKDSEYDIYIIYFQSNHMLPTTYWLDKEPFDTTLTWKEYIKLPEEQQAAYWEDMVRTRATKGWKLRFNLQEIKAMYPSMKAPAMEEGWTPQMLHEQLGSETLIILTNRFWIFKFIFSDISYPSKSFYDMFYFLKEWDVGFEKNNIRYTENEKNAISRGTYYIASRYLELNEHDWSTYIEKKTTVYKVENANELKFAADTDVSSLCLTENLKTEQATIINLSYGTYLFKTQNPFADNKEEIYLMSVMPKK